MSFSPPRWVVALDGGTTNTRARLLDRGRVVATARRAVGVRDAVIGSTNGLTLAQAVREAMAEVLAAGGVERPDAVAAAGMLTADVGLVAVPHVVAPAGLDELARAAVLKFVPEIGETPILFIPGVRTPGGDGERGWTQADVMRGEECETLGARIGLNVSGPAAFVWPGSHTKLVEVDASGRIARSFTTLAGETTSALAQHTLIAASLPRQLPESPDRAAFDDGAACARAEGLGRAAFLVRIAALTGAMDEARRAAFWVGAVVGDDARWLARHPIVADGRAIWVGGRDPLREAYAACLEEATGRGVGRVSPAVAEEASALGVLAILERRSAMG